MNNIFLICLNHNSNEINQKSLSLFFTLLCPHTDEECMAEKSPHPNTCGSYKLEGKNRHCCVVGYPDELACIPLTVNSYADILNESFRRLDQKGLRERPPVVCGVPDEACLTISTEGGEKRENCFQSDAHSEGSKCCYYKFKNKKGWKSI